MAQSSFPSAADPSRSYSSDEQQRLSSNLQNIYRQIDSGALSESPLTLSLLCSVHRALFDGVRSHAGKCRALGFGQEFLVFGPHRSTHRDKVQKELDEVLRQGEYLIKETQALNEGREEQALRIALSIHARIIKIHPFEDGNGRTSRAIADYVLVRLGLEPIPIEAVKQEYINALHHFFESQFQDFGPLVDVYLRAFEASSTT